MKVFSSLLDKGQVCQGEAPPEKRQRLMNSINETPAQIRKIPVEEQAVELLELIYFFYDKAISTLGNVTRGELTRTQAGILWLIRAEGENARSLPRKDIAQRLHVWFDLSSPAITNALHAMARQPLGLVRLIESADSGREKRVFLTSKGERFALAMTTRGRHLVQELIGDLGRDLSGAQIIAGVEFLRMAVAFFQRIHPSRRLNLTKLSSGSGLRPMRKASRPRTSADPNRTAS
jgi:DNA-binding MarR family transcriptional regulator